MNDYIPDPSYGANANQEIAISKIGAPLRYNNIILTILLVAVLIIGAVTIAMMARISMVTEENGKELEDLASDVSTIELELDHISETLDDGCSGSTANPYDPYDPYPYSEDKPVIYLYGDGGLTEAHVELELKDAEMNVTWPEASREDDIFCWDVSADTDGTLYDGDGNEYSYLFWEADTYLEETFEKGYCVAGSDTAAFLKSTLAEIGLSSREANEFIVYWLPRMQGNAYNLISFEGLDPSDEYNSRFRLSVSDAEGNAADSMLRVMMVWKAVDAPVLIQPQEFEGFERSGFTVVEWGGCELTKN
ncbi:MAG: hypothetical protein IK115_12450 [Lachnospiraceae bacterium]|nr:hypothetical protein [Lachnospiraceae bacterium]